MGEWYNPDDTIVPRGTSSLGFFRTGSTEQVRLNRMPDVISPVGAYECRIPDSNGVEQVAVINIQLCKYIVLLFEGCVTTFFKYSSVNN